MTTVVELGPVQIRVVTPSGSSHPLLADPRLSEEALAGLDDSSVLVGDQVRSTGSLWAQLWDVMLDEHVEGTLALIAPSTWPRRRIDVVSETLRHRVDRLDVRSRCVEVARTAAGGSGVVVEIGPELVGVTRVAADNDVPTAVVGRDGPPEAVAQLVAAEIVGAGVDLPVLLDVAGGVPGAIELGQMIARNVRDLADAPKLVVCAGDRVLRGASPQEVRARPRRQLRRRRTRLAWSVTAAVMTLGVLVVQVGAGANDSAQPVAVVREGGVAVNVPALWPVDAVTDGTGSARLQVNSPLSDEAALHITQSRVPQGESLERTAGALRRLVAAEAPGIFVDFNPTGMRAGRPAVTYVEIRQRHDIRWNVFVDDTVRISIGCQSARGREEDIAGACDEAVRSARAAR